MGTVPLLLSKMISKREHKDFSASSGRILEAYDMDATAIERIAEAKYTDEDDVFNPIVIIAAVKENGDKESLGRIVEAIQHLNIVLDEALQKHEEYIVDSTNKAKKVMEQILIKK